MRFVEIALSGLRGLPEVRLAPTKGVNILRVSNPDQRRQLVDALFHALQVDSGSAARLADGNTPARASIAVQGKDGQLYRIVRDFGSGGTRLLKKSNEEWATISSDLSEIAQFTRVQLHLPSPEIYERLYVLSPGRLVGRGPQAESRSGGQLWPAMDVLGTPAGSSGGTNPGFPTGGWGGTNPGFPGGTNPGFPAGGTSPGFPPAGPTWGGASPPGALGGNLGFGTAPGAPILRMQSALQPSPVFAAQSPAFVTDDSYDEAPAAGSSPHQMHHTSFNALERSAPEPARAFDVNAARSEHARLVRHLAVVQSAQTVRAELDKLLRHREKLKERVGAVQAAFQAADEARENAARYAHLANVPAGTAERIKDIEGSAARRDKELERAEEERQEVERAVSQAQPKPLQQDPVFVGGIGVALVSIIFAFTFERVGIAVFNLVGAVIAAAAALAYVSVLEKQGRLTVRLAGIDEKEARANRQHDLETGVVRKLLSQLGISEPHELLVELEAAAAASAERAAAEHNAAVLEADPTRRAELEEIRRVEKRIDEIEAQLLALEGGEEGGSSVHELEKRLATISRELAENGAAPQDDSSQGGGSGGGYQAAGDDEDRGYSMFAPGAGDDEARWAVGTGGGWGGSKVRGDDGGAPPEDGTAALGAALSEVVHRPLQALTMALMPRLAQYLKAFTGGVFTGAELGPRGEIRVKPDGSATSTPVGGVEPALARAVEAAIHLAWLEAAVSRVPAPILVDDPFIGLTPSARKLIGQSFGYMGDKSQVILVTSETDIPGKVLGQAG